MIPPLLQQRVFRTFWLGQTASLVGDEISLLAVPLAAVLLLDADAGQMGLLTAVGLLPSLLFSLPAGVWIDRRGRRRATMLIADVARALLMASVPVAYLLGVLGLGQLYAVAFAVGTFDVLFAVSYSTLFVSTVPADSYVEGQALLQGSRAMAGVAGRGLAGLLVAVATAPGAVVVDAATFLLSALALGRIRPEEPPGASREDGGLSVGARFIRRSPVVRAALGATTTVNYFTFAFNAIFILYASQELGVGPAALGVVLGIGGLGAVVGSLVTSRVARRIGVGRACAVGCILFPAPLALVPLATGSHSLVLVFLFLSEFGSGLGVMMLDISIGALFAAEIPAAMRARVSGAYRMVNYGVRPLGAVTGGALGSWIGLRATLGLSVAGASACALWLVGNPLLERPQRSGTEVAA